MNFSLIKHIAEQKNYQPLAIKPGQFVEVHETIGEGSNKRTRKFKGLVIKTRHPKHPDGTFMMRGLSSGVVVEKIYPFTYPGFEKVIILDEYKIRRSKLYYMRDKVGKDAKMKSLLTVNQRDKVLFAKAK